MGFFRDETVVRRNYGIIIIEFGPEEFLARISDRCGLGNGLCCRFRRHSSGVTTTLCGALKEGLSILGDDCSLAICGGKAKRAIRTPDELPVWGKRGMDVSPFIEMSRLCAKIDMLQYRTDIRYITIHFF
jgi:hypothetical protein